MLARYRSCKQLRLFLPQGYEDEAELHGVAGLELGHDCCDVCFEFLVDIDAVLVAPHACTLPLPMDDPSLRVPD